MDLLLLCKFITAGSIIGIGMLLGKGFLILMNAVFHTDLDEYYETGQN